jgi:hypothetical protein
MDIGAGAFIERLRTARRPPRSIPIGTGSHPATLHTRVRRLHHHGELGDVLHGLLVRGRLRSAVARRDSLLALVFQGLVINRIAGVPHPLWAPRAGATETGPK